MTLLKYTGIGIIEKFTSKKGVLSYNYRNRPAQPKINKTKARILTSKGISGKAEIAPATKSKESPGRNGVTTNPVSQKSDYKQYDISPSMIFLNNIYHILVNVKYKVQ